MKLKQLLRILFIILVFFLLILFFQDKLIFFPTAWQEGFELPTKLFNCSIQPISLKTLDGIELNAIYAQPNKIGSHTPKVVLFCHGNAGNLIHRLERIDKICEMGFTILAFDYRGFGKSKGSPSVAGAIIDGKTALNYLVETKKIPTQNIILYGVSLGTGIASQLLAGAEENFAGLILESGFASLGAQANRRFPRIGTLILKHDLPTIEIVKNYRGKLLVIHSKNDRIIPYGDGSKVFAACPSEQKSFLTLEGTGHNSPVWLKPEYAEAWQPFK